MRAVLCFRRQASNSAAVSLRAREVVPTHLPSVFPRGSLPCPAGDCALRRAQQLLSGRGE